MPVRPCSGSANSRLLKLLDGSHYGVTASDRQRSLLRLWIESGAAYPGTYAALGCGMIGGYAENQEVDTDDHWPATVAASEVMTRRCAQCHDAPNRLLPHALSDERGVSFWQPSMEDPRLNTSRHILFNLSHPTQSILLLGPLAQNAGGWGLCREPKTQLPATVFSSTTDPDYQTLLALCVAGQQRLQEIKRFDMPGFVPRPDWVREMRRFGLLNPTASADDSLDVYALERRYWESLWYQPTAIPSKFAKP